MSGRREALSTEALALAEAAYAEGAGSSLEVSQARQGAVGAQVDRLTTELKRDLAALELLRASGSELVSR